MIDPAEQLRRLAESRAAEVGPFVSPPRVDEDHRGAEVVVLIPRRWPRAAAAAFLLVVAAGAGAFVMLAGPSDPGEEAIASPDDRGATAETSTTSTTSTTTTILGEVVVPDLVGDALADATAELRDKGFEARVEPLFVLPNDDRVGTITEQDLAPDIVVAPGEQIVLVVARPIATTVGQNRCDRPAYLQGDFDGDGAMDRVFPRWSGDRIVEIEVCTATGVSSIAANLDLHGLELVDDIDLDGADDLVAIADAAGTQARVLSLVDESLVLVPSVLISGAQPDGSNVWWGCASFSPAGAQRLGLGVWTKNADGSIDWQITEAFINDGRFLTDESIEGTIPAIESADGPPGRDRCRTVMDPTPACDVDLGVAMVGDVDGDGLGDVVAPRDDLVCLGNGTVTAIGAPAERVGTWFLDDIDDDGRPEVFLGTTTTFSMTVQPWSIDAAGGFTPAGVEGCCEQWVPEWAAIDGVGARWFSCVGPRGDTPAGIVSGRFRVDTDAGSVHWTIDVGAFADPELEHMMEFEDPTRSDAWIPGNGCRSASFWRPAATLEFGVDERATTESVAAFNASIVGDDVNRRFVRLREALGIGDAIFEATGPYREDVGAGVIELRGIFDDSVTAIRWDFSFSADGSELVEVHSSWSCQPGRGHDEFSTEPCT